MKNIITIAFVLFTSVALKAQTPAEEIVKVKGTRLAYPLILEWAKAFNKKNPGIKVVISPESPADSIDLTIASYDVSTSNLKENIQAIVVARYVQLPIVNSHRPDLAELQERGLSDEAIGKLFFNNETPVNFSSSASPTPLSLYVRDRPVCAVKAFASHYHQQPVQLQGFGIQGDDQELANAVRRDVNGISFNNLGFIYNVTTRKVTDNLAIIPLDLNKNGKIDDGENIYGTLDTVVNFIERTQHPAFVNEKVNLLYDRNNPKAATRLFLKWILTEGQQYNHQLGFLLADEELIKRQNVLLAQQN